MKKWSFILGVDVSKSTLDVYCDTCHQHIQIQNGTEGFKMLTQWCKSYNIDLSDCIVVLEYTGGYEYKLLQFCESKAISYVRIPGLAIKRSLGITRGKNDRVDARRIARYGEEKQKQLEPSKPMNSAILELKELLAFRKRLVREMAGYKATLKERKHIYPLKKGDVIIKICEQKIAAVEKLQVKIEAAIEKQIKGHEAMLCNYLILKSIKGIGKINAMMTIAYTENFTSFADPRSYAVYAGVVPFDYSSGTSIRGKKRVSNLANKELKQELNQAARTAIRWDSELKAYAERKMQTKCYGIVLNNVKFKLILRMFALVKSQRMYVENYKKEPVLEK